MHSDLTELHAGWGRSNADPFPQVRGRTSVPTSLANDLCTVPVLKPVRVWDWGNRRSGSEVLLVMSAEMVISAEKCTGCGIEEGGAAQSQSGEAKPSKARVEPLS